MPHYRLKPRHEVASEHQCSCRTSLDYVRDIRHLKEVTNQTEHTVQWQPLDRSRGHSVSQETYGCHPVLWDWNLQVDRRCNACLQRNLIPIREAPTCCQAGSPPSYTSSRHHSCASLVVQFWVEEETLGTSSLCFSTQSGGDLVSCILPMQDITLRRFTDPGWSVAPSGSSNCGLTNLRSCAKASQTTRQEAIPCHWQDSCQPPC